MTDLTAAESRVLDALDARALVADLVTSLRVPSVTGTDAESDLQHRQAAGYRALGLDVDLWTIDVPAIRADPGFPGDETDRTDAYGVVATTGPGRPALALQGHVDVVPVGDPRRWDTDPFGGRVDGDVVHGRGACDMKAGLAVNRAVVAAVRAAGVTLERPLAVHAVVSEEDGGLGAFATMRRGHRADAAVITEPTGGAIVTANAGALTFEIRVPGAAAHGSTRMEGVSALDAFLPVHAALRELEAGRNAVPDPRFGANPLPYPISVGRVRAGDWASSVPDLLVAEGRYGVVLGEDPAAARTAFEHAVAAACAGDPWLRDHPATVSWPGGQFASGQLAAGHPLLGATVRAVRDLGGAVPAERAAPYGSDLRLYAGVGGIPTLHYGPGDVRLAHAPRERVAISECLDVARSLALLAARTCGAHL